jgi:uncharacterized protein
MRRLFLLLAGIMIMGSATAQVTHTKILGVREVGGRSEGISADLYIELDDGSGRVFLDTMPLTEIDTQASARLAAEVTCDILNGTSTGVNCNEIDFMYTVRSDYTMVGGPSAGAAMTVATMASVLNKSVASNVMITGTINPDGTIGPVGGLIEKVDAAKNAGADLVLVPEGQIMTYTSIEGSFISILVNLSTYASEQWGMEVIEIRDVEDAFKYMTGFEIVRESVSSTQVATAEYQKVMQMMAEDLQDIANQKLDETQQKLSGSTIGFGYSEVITGILSSQENELQQVDDLIWSGSYYSAASYAVNAMRSIDYANKLISYYTSTNARSFVRDQLDQISANITKTEQDILAITDVDNIYDIEVIMVSIDRIRAADELLDSALNSSLQENFESALDLASFANVRRITAEKWADVANYFTGDENITFNISNIKYLAQRRIEEARTSTTYASTIVPTSSFLTQADDLLDSAETSFLEEKYVAALFTALESRALANLAMETRGMDTDEVVAKIDGSEEDALNAIADAEELGLLPILAISYLEYGKTFEETNPVSAVVFLGYSKEFAKVSYDIVSSMSGTYSLLPEAQLFINPATFYVTTDSGINTYLIVTAGFLLGIVISLYKIERSS